MPLHVKKIGGIDLANLIITIIGIAIIGIAAAMAVYYGGAAFGGSQGQIYANTLISESQQLMSADMQYMLDKGLGSFADFGPDAPAIAGYTQGRVPILGLTAYAVDGNTYNTVTALDPTAIWNTTNATTSPYFGVLGGQYIYSWRGNDTINGTNAILYYFWAASDAAGDLEDLAPASMANHPLVQMCKAINAQMPPPAGMTYSASGLPEVSNTSTLASGAASNLVYYVDPVRTTLNYCYLGPAAMPAGSGIGTGTIFFDFSN